MTKPMIPKLEERLIFAGHPTETAALPIALNGLGIHHLQEHIDRPRGIEPWQWIQCTHGRGEMIFEGQVYPVEEGFGMLLPPDTPHIYYGLTSRWYVNFLCFNGPCLTSVMETLGLNVPGVYRLSRPGVILSHEERLYESYMETPTDSRKTSAIIYELLLELGQDITQTAFGQSGAGNEKVHKAICYMYDHYQENISLQDIADAAGLTREYLCQLFKKHTHTTVLDYLVQIRIAGAKTLLIKYPGQTVARISALCGFETPSYFSAVFKKYEKQTPGEFRRMRR